MCGSETKRPPVEGLSYGFIVSWPDMSVDARGFGRSGGGGSILTGGHVSILCSHQALFAQLFGLLWWLGQRLLWDDLSTRLGHPDSSLHSSAAKHTCGKAWSQPRHRTGCMHCLTFPVLVVLTHCPHADLFVDHIDTREAADNVQ